MSDLHQAQALQAVKTEGQAALEELLAVRDGLAAVDRRFRAVLSTIGAAKGAGGEPGNSSPGKGEDRFFPALQKLTADLRSLVVDLELKAADFEQRF
ncbi:MAG: hypothetical protein JWR80_4978 [Bradyrhizobium sp.]|nr:hypothetical protein [Bradyrhizobium sp.]